MARYTAVSVDDVEAVDWRGIGLRWHPLRGALGTRIVGMAAYSAVAAGDLVVEPHDEVSDGRGQEEVYLVLRGRARFEIDGAEVDAPAGTLVRIDPAARREAVAREAGTWVIALGGESTFAPAASEWIERARPLVGTDPVRAAAIVDQLAVALPDSGGVAVGRALLAVGRGDDAEATRLLNGLIAAHPEVRHTLRDDVDLGRLLR